MKLIVFSLFLLVTSCKKQQALAVDVTPPTQNTEAKKFSYLALGDSYTIGQSVPAASSFPVQISNALNPAGFTADPLKVIAQTGWTSSDLITAIKDQHLNRTFDVVTLLIGVNNQFRGSSEVIYRQEFKELLSTALTFANGDKSKVFVISIPDWGVTPYAQGYNKAQIAKEIDAFNAINKEETLKAGISYTDITPISRTAETDRTLIAGDGLHPSGNMYKLWVDLLSPKVLNLLNK